MGVDRSKNCGPRDRHEFESVYRSRLRRMPTKFRHVCSNFKSVSHHRALAPSNQHRCRVPSGGSRGDSVRRSASPRRPPLFLQKSPRKNYSLAWKYRKFHGGCSLLPQVLDYESTPFSHSSSPSPLIKLSFSSKMAHANPGTPERSDRNHLDKFQLPLYYHGNQKSCDSSSEHEAVTPLYVLGIPLHKLSRTFQFLVCVFGVMFFYLLYGYTQEWIFSIEGFKPYGWYLTLIQFGFYALFGTIERQVRREPKRKVPLKTYAFLAFLTVATMGLSNTSLGYLNYPTQVIFKSCKLIPVMVGGMIIQGKKYTLLDGVALVCMSVGLILFTLADSTVQPNFDQTGVLLISLALCADAVIGNVQEKALKQHSASNVEMVLYSYAVGFVYILVGVLVSQSFLPAFLYCLKNPHMYLMAAVFSLTGYLGINFVLVLVRSFGALLAVTVTTFRKAVTMVLSFLLFTKPFTAQYVWAGLIVLSGIGLNVYSKNKSKIHDWLRLSLIKATALYSSRRMRLYNSPQFQV